MGAQETGTHRSKRLPARGSASENDVRVVVLVHAEEALKCRFVTDAAREFESTTVLVDESRALVHSCRAYVQLLYSEWFDVFPTSNDGQQMAQRCPAKISTTGGAMGLERRT